MKFGLLTTVLLASLNASAYEVVASFSIAADWARRVAPSTVTVTALVGPERDSHTYEPTPGDLRRLSKADLIVRVGLGFEPWLDRALTSQPALAPKVLTLSEGLALQVRDPHFWQNVELARLAQQKLADALKKLNPAQAAEITARAEKADQELRSLHEELLKSFAAIPAERKKVLTAHASFLYFGRAYGLEFLAPQGWSTGADPSAKQVAGIIRQIQTQKVQILFPEKGAPTQTLKQIARDAGLRWGAELYADSLSKEGGPAATYVEMMRSNAKVLLESLSAPTTKNTK